MPLSQLSPTHVSLKLPLLLSLSLSVAGLELALAKSSWSYVPLMAGQSARPLKGSFNNVPVLHSNQPETVTGSGILVNTAPGTSVSIDTGQRLNNARFTFNGKFGIHIHHKYYPKDKKKLGNSKSRGLLTVAAIATNPTDIPVTIRFERGAVKNSFEAPYHVNKLMGVKPLGPRPWNTGPGDATSILMLRGRLDRKLTEAVVIQPRSQEIIFTTLIPARGIANGLLSGKSDGPFQLAVVAAEETASRRELLSILNSGRLAPGRTYLSKVRDIQTGKVFSRVSGVAIGDHYKANLDHDLDEGALHVPLTSTHRHHFGTRDIQVNQLETRMIDSAVDNVGTYGVRFDVTLNLKGSGSHELVLSHPVAPNNKEEFTAFRGSIGIKTNEGYKEVHVGLRSGQSLSLSEIKLTSSEYNPVTVSLVYPADNTPGHLLSVVPVQQLAMVKQRTEMLNRTEIAKKELSKTPHIPVTSTPVTAIKPLSNNRNPEASGSSAKLRADNPTQQQHIEAPQRPPDVAMPPIEHTKFNGSNIMPPAMIFPNAINSSLGKRYQDAIKAQQEWLRQLQSR